MYLKRKKSPTGQKLSPWIGLLKICYREFQGVGSVCKERQHNPSLMLRHTELSAACSLPEIRRSNEQLQHHGQWDFALQLRDRNVLNERSVEKSRALGASLCIETHSLTSTVRAHLLSSCILVSEWSHVKWGKGQSECCTCFSDHLQTGVVLQ